MFYSVGIGGVIVLTSAYLTIYYGSGNWLWGAEKWQTTVSIWNTLFILWLGTLFYIRGKQKANSDWTLAFAVAFLLAALAWLVPAYWSLSLVYLHPFVAMWFLERQIRRTRQEWLKAYHFCLASIPVFLAILWLILVSQPNLSEEHDAFMANLAARRKSDFARCFFAFIGRNARFSRNDSLHGLDSFDSARRFSRRSVEIEGNSALCEQKRISETGFSGNGSQAFY